ncbi:hypothetical protein C8Q72DRAFT_775253 [Fomitopsis betulina]|nr:hypothetical protein C8Q72DRAFT_775253 [Fomitopsis betulina]
MDIAFDTTWCPVCSRQILPKRYYVPINATHSAPVVPPSSPTSEPKANDDMPPRLQRTKTGTIRARGGGLVQGTGRDKHLPALKRDTTVKSTKKPLAPEVAVESRAPGPVRHRTVIDQSPVPLYCSDECRLADLQSSLGAMGMEYKPDCCTSPSLPPVPHNSFSDCSSGESDCAASFDSRSSLSSSPPSARSLDDELPAASDAYTALTKLFPDLPPRPPPAPPLIRRETNDTVPSFDDYQSGVMMSAQRIRAALCTEPPRKRSSRSAYPSEERRERKPIPGWTDGSHAWRASVYNLSAPFDMSKPHDENSARGAYKGFVASSQRSGGVYSTVSTPTFEPVSPSSASFPAVTRATAGSTQIRSRSETDELSKYPLLHSRSDSRQSLGALSTSPTGSTRSMPATTSMRRKEVSLVKLGAEGRLLVPDVKMTRSPSTTTVSSVTSTGSSYGYYPYGRKPSPLSRQNSDASIETADSLSTEADLTMRPTSSDRSMRSLRVPRLGTSWSYSDDTMTFPILQIPKKEKRIERRVVEGKEQDVEVEVEVHQPLKRLFLFPGKDGR